MLLGSCQIEITPRPGVELAGFAARAQPSTGVLDPLFARALYLDQGGEKLLWLHCDLIGFNRAIVEDFRRWAAQTLGLAGSQVMLSATHTHSGPCTTHRYGAGGCDTAYVQSLHNWLQQAASSAVARVEPVAMVSVEGRLELAVDRRKTASAHTDPRVTALGFRRPAGGYAAIIVNYPMHPVALGASNRLVSADVPGQAALALARQLPGGPVVLVTNGACANLNPPAENVPASQVVAWGRQIAGAILPLLQSGVASAPEKFRVMTRLATLPLDTLDEDGINAFAAKALKNTGALDQWGDTYRRVVEHWRSTLVAEARAGRGRDHWLVELFAVILGDVVLVGANAEVFSRFTDWLRRQTGRKLCLIGYANGNVGYLPTRAAYLEGGYEVDVAHLFYGGFRPQAGNLEALAREAVDLLRAL